MWIDVPGPALLSSMTQNSTAKGPTPTPTPPPFSAYAGFASNPSASQSSTPQPGLGQYSAFSQPPQKTSDPFAALSSSQFSSKPTTPQPPATPAAAPAASNDDDEWSFSSALPPESSAPREHQIIVSNTALRVHMKASRQSQSPNAIHLLFVFSNTTPQHISDLHFQLAVTKVRIFIFIPSSLLRPAFLHLSSHRSCDSSISANGKTRAMNFNSNHRAGVPCGPTKTAA